MNILPSSSANRQAASSISLSSSTAQNIARIAVLRMALALVCTFSLSAFVPAANAAVAGVASDGGIIMSIDEDICRIFPNPASSFVEIEFKNGEIMQRVEILAEGIIVAAYSVGESHTVINTESLQPGVYTLRITTQDNVYATRLMIVH